MAAVLALLWVIAVMSRRENNFPRAKYFLAINLFFGHANI
jgi:hypothetical protein